MAAELEKSDKNIEESSNIPYQLTSKQKRYLPVKRAIDIVVAGCASVVLSPVMGILAFAIKLDSPGPVLFKQKRVGKDKEIFEIWKFRTMRTDTPKDMPTHMLENPDAYITKVGRFMRKYSLDEFPQFWQVVLGRLALIGPRPALWNQSDLVEERDKYGANSVTPGITGWAQINGRDELEIPVKAKFDGEYVEKMSLWMDIKCFLGTIGSVLNHDGVVEGGTGEMQKEGEKTGDGSEVLVSPEKINKEIKTGAAVVGVAGAVGAGALVAIGKHFLGKKKSVQGSQYVEEKNNKHMGLKVVGAVAVGAVAGIAIYNNRMKKTKHIESIGNNSKKKIAVISSHTHSLFWFRMNMMQDFLSKGYEVIALGQESESEWSGKFAENGIEYRKIYVERNGVNPAHDLKTLKELDSFLKKEKPDKIFCYQAKTIIYTCLAAKKNGISEVYPLVAGLGSIFDGTSIKGKLLKTVMRTEYKVALKNSKAVMFQNNDDMSAFVNDGIVKGDKCRIINGSGVDVEKFTVMPMPKEPAFLMITRLIRDKGVVEYIDACRLIKKNNPTVRCLLVGPYDTNPSAISPPELQNYIDDGSVEYFGEQEDVRPFIEQATVFVLPSYHEGTPKTVLESMACGRAIITTDAPGCRETVTDGVNGYLVPVKEVGALADKMQLFIDKPDLAIEMGSRGRRLVEKKYDVNKVNESIMEIMNI